MISMMFKKGLIESVGSQQTGFFSLALKFSSLYLNTKPPGPKCNGTLLAGPRFGCLKLVANCGPWRVAVVVVVVVVKEEEKSVRKWAHTDDL